MVEQRAQFMQGPAAAMSASEAHLLDTIKTHINQVVVGHNPNQAIGGDIIKL